MTEPRLWQPGDPEPPNGPPYAIHAGAPGPDPWGTLCGRRVPRSAIAYRPEDTDCPGCMAGLVVLDRKERLDAAHAGYSEWARAFMLAGQTEPSEAPAERDPGHIGAPPFTAADETAARAAIGKALGVEPDRLRVEVNRTTGMVDVDVLPEDPGHAAREESRR